MPQHLEDVSSGPLGNPRRRGFHHARGQDKGGLVTYYLLFVLELATRRVQFTGLTPSPDGPWMTQIARNLTDCQDGFLNGKRYLLLDAIRSSRNPS